MMYAWTRSSGRPDPLARWVTLALAAVLTFWAAPSAIAHEETGGGPTKALEINDMFKIKRVGNPEVSPDGEWVAYTVSTSSLEPGESGTQIWMVPAAGTAMDTDWFERVPQLVELDPA